MGNLFLGLIHLGSFSLLSFEIVFTKVKQNQRPRFAVPLTCISSSTLTSQHQSLSSLVSVMLVSFHLSYCSFQVSFEVSLLFIVHHLIENVSQNTSLGLFSAHCTVFIPWGCSLAPILTVCFSKVYHYFGLTLIFQNTSNTCKHPSHLPGILLSMGYWLHKLYLAKAESDWHKEQLGTTFRKLFMWFLLRGSNWC